MLVHQRVNITQSGEVKLFLSSEFSESYALMPQTSSWTQLLFSLLRVELSRSLVSERIAMDLQSNIQCNVNTGLINP